jgi:hypothetical protein
MATRIKVKKRVLPPPPEEYGYLEQLGPDAWALVDPATNEPAGEPITAGEAIERFQALGSASHDLLVADRVAAKERAEAEAAERAAEEARLAAEAEAAAGGASQPGPAPDGQSGAAATGTGGPS